MILSELLPEKPVLKDYQKYVQAAVEERGFTKETLGQKFILFMEECGEMAKAARKLDGMHVGTHSAESDIAHEAADVFIYLLEICNMTGVDLEKAFRDKEAINHTRTWKRSEEV